MNILVLQVLGAWEIDNITINEGSTPPPTIDTVSVYDIQYTTDPNGNSNYVSQQIITGGIVTAVRSDSTFFISSGSGAWSVFMCIPKIML